MNEPRALYASSSSPGWMSLELALRPQRASLLAHPVYADVTDLHRLRVFLEHHVFAVWDFMSLLKALQRELTCTEVPWVPRGSARTRRLINELVLGEESDELVSGECTSHFELYRAAMQEVGADTRSVDAFLALVRAGLRSDDAHEAAGAPTSVRAFVTTTFSIIDSRSTPAIAAAFTLGREDVIPDMFRALVANIARADVGRCDLLLRYLERHIEVDGGSHGKLAKELLDDVCGDDPSRWHQAEVAARRAIEARIALWDGVVAAMPAASVPRPAAAMG